MPRTCPCLGFLRLPPLPDPTRLLPLLQGEGGRVVLTVPLSPSVSNLVVDELVVRVVLPEGATDVEVSARDELSRTFDKK